VFLFPLILYFPFYYCFKSRLCSIAAANLANYDNIGIINIQTKCCNVPDPLEACVPTETKVLAATCDNRNFDIDKQCNYILSVGVMPDMEGDIKAKNFYESIGYTTSCAGEKLKQKFPDIKCAPGGCKYDWKNPGPCVFRNVTNENKSLTAPKKTKVELYQIIGKCSPYTIATPKFIMKTITGDSENSKISEEPLPLEQRTIGKCGDNDKDECWEANSDINGEVPIPGLKPGVKLPTFHNIDPTKPLRREADGIVLQTPEVENWGDYGEWKYCPEGSFVSEVSPKRKIVDGAFEKDYVGVGDLSLKCTEPTGVEKGTLNFVTPGSPPGNPKSSKEKWADCKKGTTAVGIQLNFHTTNGEGPDNAAVIIAL